MKKLTTMILLLLSTSAIAAETVPVTCVNDQESGRRMCYPTAGVRENGFVRAVEVYGNNMISETPERIVQTGMSAKVNCLSDIIEITHKDELVSKGPAMGVLKQFIASVCRNPAIIDPALKDGPAR
jgi:hypothetical protein